MVKMSSRWLAALSVAFWWLQDQLGEDSVGLLLRSYDEAAGGCFTLKVPKLTDSKSYFKKESKDLLAGMGTFPLRGSILPTFSSACSLIN